MQVAWQSDKMKTVPQFYVFDSGGLVVCSAQQRFL